MKMLDLAKFKKIAEDKSTVKMRHEDGHEMTIMIKALPRIQQEQLKRLKMADGGSVEDDSPAENQGDPKDPSLVDNAGNPPMRVAGKGRSDQEIVNDQNAALAANKAPATTININAAPPAAQPPMAGTTPVTNPATQMAQASVPVQPPDVPSGVPNLNPNGTMNPTAVAQNTQAANQAQADINAAKAKGMGQIEQQYIQGTGATAQTDQNNLQDLKGHLDQFNSYIQSHPIDPKAYLENMNAGQKVTSAIGLILGGFSGGLNGTGQNPAMDFLNKQIDRDIDAQKSRMDQQKTIYGAYHQLYGDSVAANAMTKASMLDIYNHKANLLAAQLGTPQSKQAALQFGANAAIEKSKALQEAAVDLRSLPGSSAQSSGGNKSASPSQRPRGGASASWDNPSESNTSDSLLKPGATSKYQFSLSKYNKVQTPEENSKIQQEYSAAQQADKSVAAIKQLWPEMMQNRNMSGFLSEKINPNELGVIGGALGAGVGGLPGAGIGAGAGEAAGVAGQKALAGLGGDRQIKYETARNALITQVGAALGDGVTPSEKAEIAKEFAPNWWDSQETANNKLEKLIQKIKLVTKTPTLDELGLTKR